MSTPSTPTPDGVEREAPSRMPRYWESMGIPVLYYPETHKFFCGKSCHEIDEADCIRLECIQDDRRDCGYVIEPAIDPVPGAQPRADAGKYIAALRLGDEFGDEFSLRVERWRRANDAHILRLLLAGSPDRHISGNHDARRASIGGNLDSCGTKICGDLDSCRTKIDGRWDSRDTTISGDHYGQRTSVGGNSWMDKTRIGGDHYSRETKIGGDSYSRQTTIGGDHYSRNTKVGGSSYASHTKIGGDWDSCHTLVRGDWDSRDTEVGGDNYASRIKIGGDWYSQHTEVCGRWDSHDTKIGGDWVIGRTRLKKQPGLTALLAELPEDLTFTQFALWCAEHPEDVLDAVE